MNEKENDQMKKVIAFVLVLCMAIAAIPALAEEDFTGIWYLQQFGVTAATFELKADGTCSASIETGMEQSAVEGTWSADGDNVTITYQEQSLTLTFDGTDLQLSAESLAAAAGTSIPEETDLSMFASLMKLSREPGKLTAAEYAAYQTDGTLPEGKTQEEMTAIDTEIKMLMMSMFATMSAEGGFSAEGDTAQAAETGPVLETVEENFYIRESYWGTEAVYIAKVKNITEDSVQINDGKIVLKDADGSEIARREWFGTSGSRYLEPGEISVISFISDSIEEGKTVADYEVTIEARHNEYATPDVAVEVSNIELREREGFSSKEYLTAATLTNAGDEPLTNVSVLFVRKDSEGKMIDVGERDLGMLELCANSSLTFVDDVNSDAVKYCEANGLTLGEIEAFAWQEIRNY